MSNGTAPRLAASVAAILKPTFTELERAAGLAATSRRASGAKWTERDLEDVQELALKRIAQDSLTIGMGFVAAPHQVDDRDRYMLWWQHHNGHSSRLHLNFDRNSVDVYDYVEMDWFRNATPEQQRVTFGPYVDYSGSELYIITASVAVIVDDVVIGVAGADLLFGELERRLLGVLRDSAFETLVLNSERRVIASNSPRWVQGSRLKTFPAAGERLDDRTVIEVAEPQLGIGWLLAVTDGNTDR